MSDLATTTRRVTHVLDALTLPYCLVGGFAVSVRTEPRFTRDVDLAVAVTEDEAAEQASRSLLAAGFTVLEMVEQDETERLATVRLTTGDGQLVDLLFASSGIEREIVESAEVLDVVPGLTLPVATTGHLIAIKLLARDDVTRPQDIGDLSALIDAATTDDLAAAEHAVRLIEQRGFNRGRDLPAALADFVSGGRSWPPGR